MGTPKKKKVETPVIEKREPTKEYVLKRDYPTSKGIKKKGTKIPLTERGRTILTQQKYI